MCGGNNVRSGVEADHVSYRVGLDGHLPAKGKSLIVGLGHDHTALLVFFVPGLWRCRKGEGGQEGEGEDEKEGEPRHVGSWSWLIRSKTYMF